VLFNPALVLAPIPEERNLGDAVSTLADRPEFRGVELRSVSPSDHVKSHAPPTIIFHGKADTTVPFTTVQAFTNKMHAAGNRCILVGFEGQNHGFFNYKVNGNPYYDETLRSTEEFLADLGYLKAGS
jgi:dipeptidyl aminopeptidase/acylaminoacyl peptidase